MKPTNTDELFACIAQLNADISDIIDDMEYMQEVQKRLEMLLNCFSKIKNHEIKQKIAVFKSGQ